MRIGVLILEFCSGNWFTGHGTDFKPEDVVSNLGTRAH